jgi:hypothetical protein
MKLRPESLSVWSGPGAFFGDAADEGEIFLPPATDERKSSDRSWYMVPVN